VARSRTTAVSCVVRYIVEENYQINIVHYVIANFVPATGCFKKVAPPLKLFTQKNITKLNIFPKVVGTGYFFETACIR